MRELMRFFQILQNKAAIEEKPENNEVIKPESNVNPRSFIMGTFFMLVTATFLTAQHFLTKKLSTMSPYISTGDIALYIGLYNAPIMFYLGWK